MVEQGEAERVFHRPRHPYTMGLLRSVPRLDRPRGAKLETIEGLPPNLANAPPGCRFAPRCPFRIAICDSEPPLLTTDTGAAVALPSPRRDRAPARSPGRRRRASADGDAALSAERAALGAQSDQAFPVRGRLRRQARRGARGARMSASTSIRAKRSGLVGESGCGKTTVGRLILRLEAADRRRDPFDGTNLADRVGRRDAGRSAARSR